MDLAGGVSSPRQADTPMGIRLTPILLPEVGGRSAASAWTMDRTFQMTFNPERKRQNL
jgi:hypothetical protein